MYVVHRHDDPCSIHLFIYFQNIAIIGTFSMVYVEVYGTLVYFGVSSHLHTCPTAGLFRWYLLVMRREAGQSLVQATQYSIAVSSYIFSQAILKHDMRNDKF
jgi:hypothetical protein